MSLRLKSLELQGYKTFASKTNFEFPEKITAIVGPNGSGKSNIADSIRWVLGEQSFRLLRGRKTEDMIFSGSEGRSRAGMASSTITFNNEDGWLPIDFSEVSVTRRAYRDGQNDYLLNGQRVRLRDLQELFSQSGLGDRTYTLIGQGLVDSALSARPEERRKFFEEAAGIGLYRSRREDSMNRLDQTRHNLERVNDILSELEPRLRSLERQTRRFREYKSLQTDLQALLRVWYGFHWNNVQHQIAKSRQVLQERETHLNEVKLKYEELDNSVQQVRILLSEKREELNALHSQSSEKHLELEKTIRDLAVLDERKRVLQEHGYSQNTDLVRLEEEISSREKMLLHLKMEYESLVNKIKDSKISLTQSESDLSERFAQRQSLETELDQKRKLLVACETKMVELNAKHNILVDRVQNLNISLEKLKIESIELDKEILQKEDLRKNANQQVKTAEKELANFQKNMEKSIETKKHLEQKVIARRNILNQLNGSLVKLNAELETVIAADENLTGFNAGAKSLISANRKGEFSGKFKPLNEVLIVPERYETAIGAALGEYIDSIFIIGDSNPVEAIQYLSGGSRGRAILMPLTRMKSKSVNKINQAPLVIGEAIDLVEYDQSFHNGLIHLLNNTLIVENYEDALKIVDQLSSDQRVVTLNGEVFLGNGAIFIGKEPRSTMIARPRQKLELEKNIAETRAKIDELTNELNQLETDQEKREQDHRSLEEKENQLRADYLQIQKTLNETTLDFEKVNQRKQWIENQLQSSLENIKENEESINAIKINISETEKEILDYQSLTKSLKIRLAQLPVEELQSNLSHWKTNVAVEERAGSEALRRVQETERIIENDRNRFSMIRERIEGLQSSLVEIEQEHLMKQEKEKAFQTEIKLIREQTTPAEEDLKLLTAKLDSLQDEFSVVQQMYSTSDRYVTQAQLENSRNHDLLDNLRRRVEEDFGLVNFEYSNSISGPNPLPLDGFVEQLPVISEIDDDLEENIIHRRAQIRRIGPINPEAQEEYISVKERYEFLSSQMEDLRKADQDLRHVIAELDELMQLEFKKTFEAVAEEFKILFTRLFGGGSAKLYLSDEENINNTGVEIETRLPGRREQGLSLLSGGERSLTAVALIFALLRVSPPPFCVLDEVDAQLDEANVGRFCELLRELGKTIQFIVITHNRNTVQAADVIYGITMGRDSASQMISLKLDEVDEKLVG